MTGPWEKRDEGEDEADENERSSHVDVRPAVQSGTSPRPRLELAAARPAAAAAEGSLEAPSPEALLAAVLELSRTVNVQMPDAAIVHRYVEVLRRLFLRRRFAVRLLGPEDRLELVVATERLSESERDRLVISESALSRHELEPAAVSARGALVSPDYEPIFEDPGVGFDVPLKLGGALEGVLHVEYEPGLFEPPLDRSSIVPLVVQLATALGTARRVRALEEQVVHAERLASLGQLAAGVVHELNNPLTSISVYGEHLLRTSRGGGSAAGDFEKLRRIVESAERMHKLTRDLMTYARPIADESSSLRVHEVLERSLSFCEHVLSEAGARVSQRYDDGSVSVRGVEGQLHQVFINLITNACHALPAEGGELVLSTRVESEGHVVVRVEDNGSGIAEPHRARIFEPFFSTKREGKGTGLGLSIVRTIVQQHGGRIELFAREGGGTVFEVALPVARPWPADP